MATVANTPRVTTITPAVSSAGPFLVGFRLFEADAIDVYVGGQRVDQNAFTVSATFSNGYDDDAAVFLDNPVDAGTKVRIEGAQRPARPLDYVPTDPSVMQKINVELARITATVIELRREANRSLRTSTETPVSDIIDGRVPIWTPEGFISGPNAEDIANAHEYADVASTSAAAAEAAADAAVVAASWADVINLRDAVDGTERPIYRAQDHWTAFRDLLRSGALLPTYPGIYVNPEIERPDVTPTYLAQVDIVLNRLRQMASIEWSPVKNMPGERTKLDGEPYFYTQANWDALPEPKPPEVQEPPYEGPPYSSVKTLGRPVGWGVNFETFLSAVRNPDSILYEDFTALPDWHSGSGALYYGAVCSNFIARGFGWFYSPITSVLDMEWQSYGFVKKVGNGSFTSADLIRGDVVNSEGGGHIEIVLDVTPTTVTFFDQGYDGTRIRTWSTVAPGTGGLDEATAYIRSRGYALLIYDYNLSTVTYEADPFAPLPEESLPAPEFNDVVMLNRGNRSNYSPGEDVRFNVVDPLADDLVIMRGVDVVETIPLSAPEIITRSFTETGDYSARCIMSDTSESAAEVFKVASISATMSVSTVERGEDVTVTFSGSNCTPHALIVQHAGNMSIGPGLIREIPAEDIEFNEGLATGHVTFTADFNPRDYHVRIRGLTDYGAVYTEPMNDMTLTVEN